MARKLTTVEKAIEMAKRKARTGKSTPKRKPGRPRKVGRPKKKTTTERAMEMAKRKPGKPKKKTVQKKKPVKKVVKKKTVRKSPVKKVARKSPIKKSPVKPVKVSSMVFKGNRQCKSKSTNITIGAILNKCTSIKNITDFSFITSSNDAVIYLVTIGNKDYILKQIYGKSIGLLEFELEWGVMADKKGFGPKIYDAFYIVDGSSVIQFILMEKYDMDLFTFIVHNKKSPKVKTVVEKAIKNIHKLIDNDLFCHDIRTRNFVVNESNLNVKMIDFGVKFCREERLSNKQDYKSFLAFQLLLNIKYEFNIKLPSLAKKYVKNLDSILFILQIHNPFVQRTFLDYGGEYSQMKLDINSLSKLYNKIK